MQTSGRELSLLHHFFDRRLDARHMARRMYSFPSNHSQLGLPRRLGLRDGRFGPLDCFFDVETVQIDRSGWGLYVVL